MATRLCVSPGPLTIQTCTHTHTSHKLLVDRLSVLAGGINTEKKPSLSLFYLSLELTQMLAPSQPLFTLRALVGQSPLVALCTPGDTIGKRHRYLLQYSPEQ